MEKLALYATTLSTILLLCACDSGDSSAAQTANACLSNQASTGSCETAMQRALSVPANPGILSNLQTALNTATNTNNGSGGQTDTSLSNVNTVTTLDAGFDANAILDQKNSVNYEKVSTDLQKGLASAVNSAAAAGR